jgi:hypothetical protein
MPDREGGAKAADSGLRAGFAGLHPGREVGYRT